MTGVFGDHQLGIPYRSIAELFAHYRDRDPGKAAIVDLDSESAITFGELDRVTTDIAAFLKSRGVAKGSRVLLLSDENLEKLLLWFGIWRIGAVVCPLNVEINAKVLADLAPPQFPCLAVEAHLPRLTNAISPDFRRRAQSALERIVLRHAVALALVRLVHVDAQNLTEQRHGILRVAHRIAQRAAVAQAQAAEHGIAYPGPPVPARFAASLVATEDHRFYSEPGLDPFAVARVIESAITRKGDQGGATIDQQLAKMLYTPGASGALAKAKQVGLAVKLSLSYSHPQILLMYADVAYFGHGYYGLSAASCGYFGTTSAGLSWPEAAMLAGLVQGPSTDDPILHFAQARAREQHVLGRLVATHTLSQAQADAAFAQRLHLVGGPRTGCTA